MTQKTNFPVVMIGGPPNSGKSVLVRAISTALRQHQRAHYILRAAPDGEGDWFNAIPAEDAKALRQKGTFTIPFVNRLDDYLSHPHFPLLIDVGGRPTADQAAIFRHCTHAVLLVGYPGKNQPDKGVDETYAAAHADWHRTLSAQQVPIIADLKSDLEAADSHAVKDGVLSGVVGGLGRSQELGSPTIKALIEQLLTIFTLSTQQAAELILPQAPEPSFIDLEAQHRAWFPERENHWQPEDLLPLQQAIPPNQALAVYGRAPIWVYAKLADWTRPAPLALFDARLGWTRPARLTERPLDEIKGIQVQTGWGVLLERYHGFQLLHAVTQSQYLDENDSDFVPIPLVELGTDLIVSGKMPNWLWMGIVRQVRPRVRSIAIYQPQINGAAVIFSQNDQLPENHVVPVEASFIKELNGRIEAEANQKNGSK